LREFWLVPWRPALERQLGKPVAAIMRGDGSTGSSVVAVADQLSLDRSLFFRMLSYI
jgi:hypothetical protein